MTMGKTQGLAPIPVAVDRKVVGRYVHASPSSSSAAAAAGPRQVAGRLCHCLLGSCRRDCAPLIDSDLLPFSLAFSFVIFATTCRYHSTGHALGTSLSPVFLSRVWREGNREPQSAASAADGVGQPLNFLIHFFLGFCKQRPFVLQDAVF